MGGGRFRVLSRQEPVQVENLCRWKTVLSLLRNWHLLLVSLARPG